MSRFGVFRIADTEYDLDDITLDEMETIEEIAGGPFSELNYGSSKAMKAFATVLLRRSNPEITPEEIGKVRLIDFVPADEEMPESSPTPDGAEESQSDSAPGDSGNPDSPESTPG